MRGLDFLTRALTVGLCLLVAAAPIHSQPVKQPEHPFRVNEKISAKLPTIITAMAMSADGKWLSAGDRMCNIIVWDIASFKEKLKLQPGDRLGSLTFDPKGTHLFAAVYSAKTKKNTLRFWDIESGRETLVIELPTAVLAMAFHPNGHELILGCGDGTVEFRNPENGKLRRALRPHRDAIKQVAFTPNGKMLATACMDRTIKLCDGKTGDEIHTLKGHRGAVEGICFNPDGTLLASASLDNTIKIWNTKSGEEQRSIPMAKIVLKAVWTPDGSLLVSGSGTPGSALYFHQSATGKMVLEIGDQQSGCRGIAFHPKGTVMATAFGHVVKLWEVTFGTKGS